MSTESIPQYPSQPADPDTMRQIYTAREAWRYENLYKGNVSPDTLTGLGRRAVISSIDHAIVSAGGKDDLIETVEGYKHEDILKARQVLHDIAGSGNEKNPLGELVTLDQLSPWLANRLAVEQSGRGLLASLTKQNNDGSYAVDDDTFMNFLEWHNHAVAHVQTLLEAKAPELKDEFAARIYSGVRKGWIPKQALNNLQFLDDVHFVADDGINTINQNMIGGTTNYGERNIKVAVSPIHLNDSHLHTHELLHAVAGKDKEADIFENIGMKRVFGNGFGGVSMDEAVVEHLSSSLVKGDIETIDPTSVARSGDTYYPERNILTTLAREGVVPIDIRLFIDAYFANGEDDIQAELRNDLKAAFPFTDVVQEISELKKSNDDVKALNEYNRNLVARVNMYKTKQATPMQRLRYAAKRATRL